MTWRSATPSKVTSCRWRTRCSSPHVADGRAENLQTIAQTLWSVLADLAEHGPTSTELAHQLDGHLQGLDDPREVMDELVWAATRLLRGEPALSARERAALAQQVSTGDVRAWAQAAQASALIGLPEDVRVDLPEVTDLDAVEQPATPPVAGTVFGRRLTAVLAPRDLQAVAGLAGISLRAEGYTWSGTWDDVVGVARGRRDRGIVLADGRSFSLCDRHLRGTGELFEVVDRYAVDKVFDVPDDEFH